MMTITHIDLLQAKRALRLPFKVAVAGQCVSQHAPAPRLCHKNFELTLRLESSGKTAFDNIEGTEYHTPFPHYVMKRQGLHHHYTLEDSRRSLFFIFPRETQHLLNAYGLLQIPVIGTFDFSGRLAEEINRVQELMKHSRETYVADQIDLAVFHIFQELFFQQKTQAHEDRDQHEKMREIASYLDSTLGEPHSVSTLAERFGYSQRSLFRYWKESFHLSPLQYIQRQRIKRAEYLLRNTAIPIAEIARQLGFCDDNYFSATFRKLTGVTPTHLRRQSDQ